MINKFISICIITIITVFKFITPIWASEIKGNIEIFFADDASKSDFSKITLNYLEKDFASQDNLIPHFFCNKEMIEASFLSNKGLIATYSNKFAGFLIWDKYELGLEIDIVEVNKDYRKKGIFKRMVNSLIERFPETCVLTGSIVPQSRRIFKKEGWQNIEGCINNNQSRYFKIIRPVAMQYDSSFSVKKDEFSIAIAFLNNDWWNNQNDDEKHKKYFKLNLDKQGNLTVPIVAKCPIPDSEIWIYKGENLIDTGKLKYFLDKSLYEINTNIELIGNCRHDMLTIRGIMFNQKK